MKYIKKITWAIFGVLYIINTGSFNAQSQNVQLDNIYNDIEFKMPKVKEVSFPDYEVNIIDFGAIGNGLFKNTLAFEKSISQVSQKGGGKVIVPRGIWLTGPITLQSNINLYLESGAIILFSKDFDDYPLKKVSFEGLNTVRCISPINANNAQNIAITGNGIIDGNGDAWRPVKKMKMTDNQWNSLKKSGGVLSDDGKLWFPSESSKQGYENTTDFNVPNAENNEDLIAVKDFLRPVMVSLVQCKKVLLDGPTFQNSPAWNIHPLMCEDLIFRNLTVRNPWYSQNGDGLDLDSCKNALIYNNTFDVGDDAICIKSGKNKDGRDRKFPTENVIVKNNVVYHGHGGVVVGSEMSSGVKNVHVSNCSFIGTDTGLRFKSTRGRGGVVENVFISNIDMIDIKADAIRFNLYYGGKSPVSDGLTTNKEVNSTEEVLVEVTEETPSFKNIFMNNIHVSGAEKAGFFMGLPEMNLKNINLSNAVLKANKGVEIVDVDGLKLKNVQILTPEKKAITIYNGKNVNLDSVSFQNNQQTQIELFGSKTKAIRFQNVNFDNSNLELKSSKEVIKREVFIN
ncbi:glycoside hydrolase family 28 protein [Pseudotamlana carrageenivorans]|uniref:Glycoside hydrolase n=1 Tax=Pseudotamlana carrageenivorans TaxID=2069432 RepID=A0A2I7SMA3_9FLAO|nr:glycoside hydrolase family 28 protein [Tamlana carrageenivorans]AUS07043.1 glycoside hydrolase [Tamlana carrageenivorans]